MTAKELLKAIHAMCMSCCSGSRSMVDRCNTRQCPLYNYRPEPRRKARKNGWKQIGIDEILKEGL